MMNKKEQAAFDDLQKELRLAKAFRFTPAVCPDLPPPPSGRADTKGYDFNVAGNRVEPATSTTVSHYFGAQKIPGFGGGSQGARPLYSTRLRALQALRHEVEQQCATRLAAIDAQIEKESAPTTLPQ